MWIGVASGVGVEIARFAKTPQNLVPAPPLLALIAQEYQMSGESKSPSAGSSSSGAGSSSTAGGAGAGSAGSGAGAGAGAASAKKESAAAKLSAGPQYGATLLKKHLAGNDVDAFYASHASLCRAQQEHAFGCRQRGSEGRLQHLRVDLHVGGTSWH